MELDLKTSLIKMEKRLDYVKSLPQQRDGVYLNLGCGGKTITGFINIDKFHKDKEVLNLDMLDLPYPEGHADAIYSSHAIEHLPIRLSKLALHRWHKLLKIGGKLYLAVPDLELIAQNFLASQDNEQAYNWYMFCMFGYQVNQEHMITDTRLDLPPYDGEFHYTGYTKKSMMALLNKIGYKLTDIFSYDGWGTPSIWVEAEKV